MYLTTVIFLHNCSFFIKHFVKKYKISCVLIFTNTIDNAQYIVTNYIYGSKKPHIKDTNLINDFKLVYEINLDNVSINSIYKKKWDYLYTKVL